MRVSFTRSWILTALLFAVVFAAPAARGHEGLGARMDRLDERLGPESTDAALFVERAGLHRLCGDWMRALEDLERAEELDPVVARAARIDLERARVHHSIGNLHAARACADAHLEREPEDSVALALRGNVLMQLGQPGDAARDLELALGLARTPTPDLIVARARALVASGHVEDALRELDEWIGRLGPAVSLVIQGVDLCVQLGRYDAALVRLDALGSHAKRGETWLVRRAEILARADRCSEARAAFEDARRAIEALGERQRTTRAVLELGLRIDGGLARLHQGGNRP